MCQQSAFYLGQYFKAVFSSFIGVISYPTLLTLFLRRRKLHNHQSHSELHQHSKLPRDATFTPEVLNIYLPFVSSQISCSLKPNLTFVALQTRVSCSSQQTHSMCFIFSLSWKKRILVAYSPRTVSLVPEPK